MKRLLISLDVRPYRAPKPTIPHGGPKNMRYSMAFESQMKRYQNRKRTAVLLILGFLLACAMFTETNIGRAFGIWGFGLLVACWIVGMGIMLFGLVLTCPACRKRLMPAKGRYCPQCGSNQFDRGSHVRGPAQSRFAFCPACDGTIYDGDNEQPRTYLIRGCTHCGIRLDEKGV